MQQVEYLHCLTCLGLVVVVSYKWMYGVTQLHYFVVIVTRMSHTDIPTSVYTVCICGHLVPVFHCYHSYTDNIWYSTEFIPFQKCGANACNLHNFWCEYNMFYITMYYHCLFCIGNEKNFLLTCLTQNFSGYLSAHVCFDAIGCEKNGITTSSIYQRLPFWKLLNTWHSCWKISLNYDLAG